ncbi:phage tail protein [Ilyobacter sp.]|uniref:phage tail protein n=1 Tax=Ilyobacter sp. TaxID=3100343 RepID=UPI003566C771
MADNYTTSQGDTWDLIAYKIWETEKYTWDLMKENQVYKDTATFSAGVVLNVPDITIDTSSENLPPWKR